MQLPSCPANLGHLWHPYIAIPHQGLLTHGTVARCSVSWFSPGCAASRGARHTSPPHNIPGLETPRMVLVHYPVDQIKGAPSAISLRTLTLEPVFS